jgi:hypothetical protein
VVVVVVSCSWSESPSLGQFRATVVVVGPACVVVDACVALEDAGLEVDTAWLSVPVEDK